MNKIFKVVWNRTIQSFVVTSELAKGRVKSSAEQNSADVSAESGKNGIATVFRLTVISAALFGASNAYAATAQVGRIEVDNTTSATAISGATATGVGALGVGLTAQANQGNAIAIGNSAQAQTGNTIAIGKSAVANSPASGNAASSAIALGADANATGLGTIAIGRASGVLSQNIMNVNVTHNNIAIGNTARVGDSSSSKITQSIAIGSGNRVDPQGRPEGAWAKGDQSIAVGGNVLANGNSSVAIGGDDLDAVGGTRYSGNATDKFIKYNAQGAKTGEYTLSGKSLRDIYKEMTGDTMNYGSYGNTIAGQGSVALGVQSNSSADLSLAIGTKSQATAFGGVALGTGAKATLLNSVALGTASKTDKEGKAYVQREIMGETYTWAGGQTTDAGDVVSVGSKGYERQIINVSPGDISATSTDAINGSQLYGVLSAIERVRYFSVKSEEGKTDGTKNWNNDGAKATNSIAIGPNAATSTGATGSVSLGHNANVLGEDSVAVGPNATVTSRTVGAVALGSNANSRGTGSIAIGLNTENDRNYSIVVGAHSRANYENATVVGARAAAQNNGTAMGYLSNAVGDDSVAIGHQAQTTQAYSIAIGKQANSSGLYSTAIGSSAQAAGQNSFAGGNNAKATGSDSVALGNGATTTIGSSVALGNGAVGTANNFDATAKNATFKNDSGTTTNVSYAASSSAKTGAVSVGSAGNERQIHNVAAGRISATSTDAVNGSQLYTVMNNVGHNIQQNGTDKSRINNNGTVNYADGNLTTVAITDGENASKVQINVTQGTLSVDNNGTVSAPTAGVATAGDVANAINNAKTTTKVEAGSNTHVNKTISGKETTYTVSADKATVQVSNALNLTSNTTTAADGAVTTDYSIDLAQDTKDDIQKGVDAKTTVDTKGLTFNGDSGSTNVEKLGSTVTVAGDDNITTEAQDDKVTVKLNKDLVVDSVKAGDTTVNNDGVKVGDDVALTQDGVKAGDVKLTKDGLNNAGNKVTNVADGDLNANSKDAVNGSQLFATNQNVANNAANIAKGINFGGTTGSNNYALGDTINVKGDSNIISETVAGGAQLKLAKDITVDSVTAGDSKLNSDGLTITGGPSVTKAGINAAGNKITNVAPGTDDTDAVNYSQLKQQSAAARTEVRAGTNIKDVVKTVDTNGQDVYTVNAKGTTASAGSNKVTVTASAADANNVTDYSIDLADNTKADIQKGVDAKTTVDSKGLTFNGDSGSTNVEKLGSTVTVAGDDNITTEAQDDKVTVKLNKDLVVDSVKAGDTTVNNDGVKVGDDVALTQDGVKAGDVKLTKDGLNNAGNKVTNVADGDLNANSKDAVNGSQLFATNQNVANNAANIAKGINFGGTTGSNNYALGDTINVKGDSNIISETVAGGAQLKLAKDITVDSVTAGDSKLNSDGLTITGGPSVTKSGINAAGNKITNVAPGTDDTDAVNYSQLKQQSAAARTEVAAGTNIKDVVKTTGANGQDIYTVNAKGTTASAGSDKVTVTASAEDANNVTDYSIDLAQDTKDDIQKGVDAKTAVDNKGLTFNGDSGSTNIEKLGSTVTVAGDDNITTEAQDDKVTVKLNKDLVVDSVKAGDTTVNNDGVKVGDDVALTQDGVKAGDVKLTKDGLNNAGNKVTNVAAGTDDTDAVNYGQLKETNANVAKGLNIAADNGNDDNVQLGETVAYRSSDKNIVTTVSDNQIDFKLAKDITVDSVTAGDSKLNSDGLTITGGPSVTKSGINAAGNKITNVAPGTDDTDAVNYSQLKQQSAAARTEVAAGTNIKDVVKTTGANGQDIYTVNAKGTTASAGSDKVTVTASAEDANNVTDYSIDLAQDTKDDIQKGVDAKTAVDNKGLTFNGDSGSTNIEKLGSTVTVAGDDNITTEAQDDKVTVKLNKDLVVDSVKAGDTTVNNDGVKVGDDVALTQDGVKAGDVKLTKDGLNNAGNKVTNVADGDLNANSKDAVNGSQLFATNQNVANNAANIAKGINFGGTTGSNNYALGDTINVKGDSNIISETIAGGAQLKLADVLNVGQAAPVKIDGDKGEVSGLSNTTLGGSDFAQGKRAATEEQLNAAQDQLVNVLGGNAANNGGNISMTDIGGTGENNIHDAIKAVNATANLPLTFGGDSGKDVERKPGTKLNIVGGQTDAAKLSDGNIGVVANGSDKLEVKLAKDLAVDSVKAGDTTVNTDGVKVGDVNLTKAGLNNGGNKITNVAAGTDDTDAVNVAQLNKAAAAAKTEVVQGDNIVVTQDVGANGQTIYKVATDKNLKVDSVTAGDTVMNNDGVKVGDDVGLNKDGLKAGDVNLTKAGLNNGGNKITNVAAGTDDTDAVNVSQLKQAAAASKTEVVQGKNIVVTEKTGDKGQTVYEIATDKDLDVDSVKAGDTTVNNDGVKVGDNVALNKDGLKAGDVNLTKDGLDNAGNKVTNVADGDLNANSKDAVNGSQLYATNQNVANNAATIAKGINFGGTTGSNNYALGNTINVKGDSNIISETVAGGAQLKLADEISVKTVNADTFKAGDTVMNNDGVKVSDKVALNKDGLTAGNTVVNNDGVTIAAPTESNPNNQVKLSPVGLNNGGQRITNVAPGKDGTDAANVNQLIGLGNELQNNINQVGKKAYAGVAGAIAQGSIPQVTRPGATGIGVGSGYYGGQSAMAIGVSAMSDGGNWIVKGNFSANTDGHVGVGAGALYQW